MLKGLVLGFGLWGLRFRVQGEEFWDHVSVNISCYSYI